MSAREYEQANRRELDVTFPLDSDRVDAELRTAIRQVLAWATVIPEEGIEYRVQDGWVTLQGVVVTARQRRDAARIVGHLLGVRGVTNEIRLIDITLDPPEE